MKLNIKQIIIIFLVALLGGACGGYGAYKISSNTNKTTEAENETSNEIQTVKYTDVEKGDYTQVIDKAINSIVEITTKSTVTSSTMFGTTTSDQTALGSGVIITEDGYIVTNNHVVEDATDVSVTTYDGNEYEADIIGTDAQTDLALIKIDASDLTAASFADSDSIELGQEVVAIGNALGKGTSCSNGIVSVINKEIKISNYTMKLIQTDAAVNEGNSGGGLFDMNGNLIGIVNSKSSSSSYSSTTIEGMGYAIPSNTVKTIVEELKENGYVKDRPALGVRIYSSSYNEYYNVEGLVISEVLSGSAAEKAGLKANDIITAVDGTTVSSFSDLSTILNSHEVGDKVELQITRDNKVKNITVTLQESVNSNE